MFADHRDPRARATSMALVIAIHVALGYALIVGLGIDVPGAVSDSLKTFAVLPPPPPRPPEPKPKAASHRAPRKEGAAAPANLTAKATPIVAPKPIVILPPPPPPVVASIKAGEGAADHAGAAPVPGPGTGSGGIGNGTGSGDSGDGPGGGGSGGRPLERIGGQIRDSDYPRGAPEDDRVRRVGLRFVVGIKGRVTDCIVTRSSGNGLLDDATCALIEKRLRYRPELDGRGRPVPVTINGEHEWFPIHRGYDDEE